MSIFVLGTFASAVLGWLMGFLSLFLILLVLVQRGRGGGLTGALGGPGGQSAFGSKAGDTFTIITVVTAAIWGFVCAFTMWLLGTPSAPEPIAEVKKPAAMSSTDDETTDPTDGIVIPGLGGSGISGLGAGPADDTPSMDLTPAGVGGDAAAEPEGDAPTGTDEPAEDAPATDAPESDQPAADAASTDESTTEPAAETPSEPATESDASEPETAETEAE